MQAHIETTRTKVTFKNDPQALDLPPRIWDEFLNDAAALHHGAYLVWDNYEQVATLDVSDLSEKEAFETRVKALRLARRYTTKMEEFWIPKKYSPYYS